MKVVRVPVAVALFALVFAACSSSNKVGNSALLNVKDQVAKSRLGEQTTTTAPAVTTTVAAANLAVRPTTTRPTATTVAPGQVVTINGDRSAAPSQFDPNSATVYTNFPLRFVNDDTVPRSVVFTNGDNRRSPTIAPGQSWTTTFAVAGTYNYQDGTRPYAVGSVTVINR